jgi:alkanesulfonate monooxygenase SsuD/methylene tetrahydromethanopterin reductase-like flavin-dependent oxidoreductase (luciferase family)
MVAALRERMLKTAAAIGDGVFLNLVPLSSMARLIEAVTAGAEEAGCSIGEVEVLCRIPCVPARDANAHDLARQLLVAYATIPVYHDYFAWLGYGEALAPVVEAWKERDRLRAAEALPHELLAEIFAFGTADEQRAHVEKLMEAGITCPILMPILPNPSLSSYCEWIESMSQRPLVVPQRPPG